MQAPWSNQKRRNGKWQKLHERTYLSNPYRYPLYLSKKSKKKKADAANTDEDYYTGSINCKSGRNTNTTLYYVDYSKTSNDGNGLLPDAKNELLCNSQKAKADLVAIDLDLKTMGTETVNLLSEPINEDAATSHEMSEKEVNALREEVESCSGLKGNEKLTKN